MTENITYLHIRVINMDVKHWSKHTILGADPRLGSDGGGTNTLAKFLKILMKDQKFVHTFHTVLWTWET